MHPCSIDILRQHHDNEIQKRYITVRVPVLALKEALPAACVVIEGTVTKVGSRLSLFRTSECGGTGQGL
jgi:hypothetical protein